MKNIWIDILNAIHNVFNIDVFWLKIISSLRYDLYICCSLEITPWNLFIGSESGHKWTSQNPEVSEVRQCDACSTNEVRSFADAAARIWNQHIFISSESQLSRLPFASIFLFLLTYLCVCVCSRTGPRPKVVEIQFLAHI